MTATLNQRSLFDALDSRRAPALPRFDGPAYDHERDAPRLTNQLGRIFDLCRDSQWRTLREIAEQTGDPESSISAQLRHLRKPRFGSHTVDKRHRGEPAQGLYEYMLIANTDGPLVTDDRISNGGAQ